MANIAGLQVYSRHRMRWWLFLLAVLLGVSLPGQLRAREHFFIRPLKDSINLQPGASCLQRDRLADAIEQILENDSIDARIKVDVIGDLISPHLIQFTIRRGHEAYAMRKFDDAPLNCQQLHDLMALSIAFAIDSTWLAKRVSEEKKPSQALLLRRFQFTGDILITGGLVPGFGLGGDLRLEFGFLEWLDLRATLMSLFSVDQSVGESSGSVDSLLIAARLDACGSGRIQPWFRMRVCVGGASGPFITRGRDFDIIKTEARPWFASVSAMEWQVKLYGRFWFLIGLDAYFPASRRVIEVLGPDDEVVAIRKIDQVAVVGRFGPIFYIP